MVRAFVCKRSPNNLQVFFLQERKMTTKRPWYPLNVPDYRNDTEHLTNREHGTYFLLMNEYWVKGSLPDDDKRLSIIAKLTEAEWREIKPTISELFLSGFRHKRIEKELQNSRFFTKRASKGAAKRWENKGNRENATAMLDACLNDATRARVLHTTNKESESSNEDSFTLFQEKQGKHEKSKIKKKIAYPDDFEAFWKAYPTTPNMPKPNALKQWERLDTADRQAAVQTIPAFKAHCAKQNISPVYAERFLSQRRFDGYEKSAIRSETAPKVFVKKDSPEGDAWWAYRKAMTGEEVPTDARGGWYFPTKWPPKAANGELHGGN
jgi:uncharacterized protein YdaU (DUF1376 family)